MKETGFFKDLTDFQRKVYKIVKTIPEGETRSYKWVAEQLGNPSACRAVGQALKKNPRPDIIPCHRVIKSNGNIGGYNKGIKLKREILRKEKNSKMNNGR